jgi:hypothetical protein
VSTLIETRATEAEREQDNDLADYLINLQREINRTNKNVDGYNAKLKMVLNEPELKKHSIQSLMSRKQF